MISHVVSFKGAGIVVDNGGNLRKMKEALDYELYGRLDCFNQPNIPYNTSDIPMKEYVSPALAQEEFEGLTPSIPKPAKANIEILKKNKKTGMVYAVVTSGNDIADFQNAKATIANFDVAMEKNAAALAGTRDRKLINSLLDAQPALKASYLEACLYMKKVFANVHTPQSMIAQIKGELIPQVQTFEEAVSSGIKLLHA